MDIHKQAIAKILASKIRKQKKAPWDFVYTLSRICHLFTQASFYMYFGFYRQKVMNYFSSSTITDNFCYLNDAKCCSNIFKMLMLINSVTRAVRAYANVICYCITVKVSCIIFSWWYNLHNICVICIVRNFLQESNAELSFLFHGVERFFWCERS